MDLTDLYIFPSMFTKLLLVAYILPGKGLRLLVLPPT